MATKTIIIKQLSRLPKTGDFDELNFLPGVNVLVGSPNAGKTQWLRMLNYLMGDRDSNPSNAFNEVLVRKYDSVKGIFSIDGEEITLERNWKQSGAKGKIFINGDPITADLFSPYLLNLLEMPVLHYPKGDPLSPRAWPELSWQTLLRHIYRRQTSWGEIANKQPDVEQHACLLLFLGVAEYIFSNQYEELATKQKEVYRKEVRKEEFVSTLNEISREILNEEELGVAVTANSIESAINRLDNEVDDLLNQRTEILNTLKTSEPQVSSSIAENSFERLSDSLASLQSSRKEIALQIKVTQERLQELERYRTQLKNELSRVDRARSAGQVFRNLRVTHCPVCEQSVNPDSYLIDHCYLCGQLVNSENEDLSVSEQRLDFEITQLRDESQEAEELLDIVQDEIRSLLYRQREIDEEIMSIQSRIRPLQVSVSAIMPPEIAQIDMDLGRIQERKRQLERIKGALELQSNLSEQVIELEHEIGRLETEVARLSEGVSFEESSVPFVAQINNYLNIIKSRSTNSWTQGEIGLRLNEKSFTFTVGRSKVSSSLGATMTLYFLAAYNYALHSLSNNEMYHYPGLTILDFPATFADGSSRTDKENVILDPNFSQAVGR